MFSFLTARSQASRNRKTVLGFDQFGERIVPAGLIDVTFQDGLLKVNGDANVNTLTVSQSTDGLLTLSTDLGTSMKVNGQNVAGFMGHTLSGPVTGGVTLNMGGSQDTVIFSGHNADVELPSFLKINGGDGNNVVTFQQGVTVGGDVTITNGVGLDTVHFYDTTNFLGKVTINNGKGGSLVDGSATTDLRTGGMFTLSNGTGKDGLDFETAQQVTLGGFTLNTGVDADGSDIDLSPVQALTINGALKITNGAGNDTLDVGDATLATKITGAVTIANGAGSNHTDVSGSDSLFIGGPITVNGGVNDDLVHFGMGSKFVSLGNITFNNGAGFNGTVINGSELSVNGNVTVNGGADTDDVDLTASAGGLITGAVKTTLGAGINYLTVRSDNDSTLTIGKTLTFSSTSGAMQTNFIELYGMKTLGATSLTTGAGNDYVGIDDATFVGKFNLNTGAGIDTVNIEQQTNWKGHTNFLGAVVVQTGAGDDNVKVSGVLAEAERKTIFGSSVKFDGGLGADTLALSTFGGNQFYGSDPVKLSF